MITFQIPNQGLINVSDTYLSFKMRMNVGTLAIGDKIIYKNCAIYKNGTGTALCTLPISTRCFIRDV